MIFPDRNLLISSQIGYSTAHGYLARRGDPSVAEEDFRNLGNLMIETLGKAAAEVGVDWIPALLASELEPETGEKVRAFLRRTLAPANLLCLDKFENGDEPLFVNVWFMRSENPECEWLNKLH